MSKRDWRAAFGKSYNGAEDQQVMDIVDAKTAQVVFRAHWINHADARLAAAAPEMAEALKAFVISADAEEERPACWCSDSGNFAPKPDIICPPCLARAALKKAGCL